MLAEGRRRQTEMHYLSYHAGLDEAGPAKAFDFSRSTLADRWRAGEEAMRAVLQTIGPAGHSSPRPDMESAQSRRRDGRGRPEPAAGHRRGRRDGAGAFGPSRALRRVRPPAIDGAGRCSGWTGARGPATRLLRRPGQRHHGWLLPGPSPVRAGPGARRGLGGADLSPPRHPRCAGARGLLRQPAGRRAVPVRHRGLGLARRTRRSTCCALSYQARWTATPSFN